jgi:hypothetical protein
VLFQKKSGSLGNEHVIVIDLEKLAILFIGDCKFTYVGAKPREVPVMGHSS